MTTTADAATERRTPRLPSGAGRGGRRRRRRERPNVLAGLGGTIWLLIVCVPIYWLVVTSLKNQSGFFASSQWKPPSSPTLANYTTVLHSGLYTYLRNSLIVAFATVLFVLVVSFMAAYLIVRSERRLVRTLFLTFMAGLAIPAPATIIPEFFIMTRLHLYDSLIGLVLPGVAFGIPVTVLILVNFLRDVPRELFEAMRLDGATEWAMLWRLAAPLSRPALMTVGIYNAIQSWNGFLFPLVLTQSPATRTLPLSLWSFQGQFTVNVPAILAAVVISALPVLALYVLGRRQLIAGLTAGFGK